MLSYFVPDDHWALVVNSENVAQAIQLALAPVFLLTAIGAILNVMAGRLARIIDRGRQLTEEADFLSPVDEEAVHFELRSLECRRHLASSAITAITLSALLVCTVIAALFAEVLLQIQLSWLLSMVFMSATISLVASLAFFLREVNLATRTIRIPVSMQRLRMDLPSTDRTTHSNLRVGFHNRQRSK